MTGRRWLLAGAMGVALLGAVLVFALDNDQRTLIDLRLQPLGGVLLAGGLLIAIGVAIAGVGGGSEATGNSGGNPGGGDANSVKAFGGLIAVVCGTLVVASLAAFTITRLGSSESDSAVAIASSAFGVISALIGAYLGIKITADTSGRTAEAAEEAAVAKHEANVKEAKITAVNATLKKLVDEDKVPEEQAAKIKDASINVEAAARSPDPLVGGGRT